MSSAVASRVDGLIAKNSIMVFSKTYCGYCGQAKKLLESENKTYTSIELDVEPNGSEIQAYLKSKTGRRTVPNIWINQVNIGGCDDLFEYKKLGKL